MQKKTLYQQAIEIYHAQQTLSSYLPEKNDAWLLWYNGLVPTEQHKLAQVAVIVAKAVDKATRSLSEMLADEGHHAEISGRVHRRFSPTSFLKAIGITEECNISTDQTDESNDKKDRDTSTVIVPGSDDYVKHEPEDILHRALEAIREQQFSKDSSSKLWFASLIREEQEILQDSVETLIEVLPEVIRSYLLVYQISLQLLSQSVLQDMTPIQQLWE